MDTRYCKAIATGYTGQREEVALGVPASWRNFYNARWYDPYLARFTQPDTIRFAEALPNPTDAKAFDRYAYVYNNPVMYSDPSGHCIGMDGSENGQPYVGHACSNNEQMDEALYCGISNPEDCGGIELYYGSMSAADYGITIDSGWSLSDRSIIMHEVVAIDKALKSASPLLQENKPGETFQAVFGDVTINLRSDGGLGCEASVTGFSCGAGTKDMLAEPPQRGLVAHELGHTLDHVLGWGSQRVKLSGTTITDLSGEHVTGANQNGNFERTNLGYRSQDLRKTKKLTTHQKVAKVER
jgi:RHS repeat-associated protein